MMNRLRKILGRINFAYLKESNFFLWLYGSYLTIRYVDDFGVFPAIQFNSYVKVKISKSKNSKLHCFGPLKFESWLGKSTPSTITLLGNSIMEVNGEFIIGNNVCVLVADKGKLILGGRKFESGSGITANSIVMAMRYVEIGFDCIIAWDTYITDSDWHTMGAEIQHNATIIGNHCWLGVGVKILKGVRLNEGTIVGTNSVVTQGEFPKNSFISGIPAKVVKTNIVSWKR